ncbi:alpha/beta hydrolase family protein [Gynuella sunshinyii]|uniref:Putative dienelactone hydrolase n=1 Tax=Gynuella sunshinyii YC6258 TaxID=1445510 RepID=A0A0C5VRG3_9GAMM|nr:alpha/beta fold hydrolase [Gynuella sunshinyii]AJQ97222.1 putative dienelactone hydrolase [Gynuella sunshinyii YC6258]
MNNLIREASHIPTNKTVQTISISPVILTTPDRDIPLELRITAPATGEDLPIILLSHGHGPSLYICSKDGYGPLANFLAEHGFVVIQPTHVNSKVAGLDASAPGGPLFWRSRVQDMKIILDRLDEIETLVPPVAGRLDREKIAAVGHSMGGQTVSVLMGAKMLDPKDKSETYVSMAEPRIKAGVLLAAPGNGGDSYTEFAVQNYAAPSADFADMTTPALVVAGDSDVNPMLTHRGAEWHMDPFYEAPGSQALLTLIGAKHGLGGIAGYDAKETDDEDPERLAIVQRMTWAYLRSALFSDDPAWPRACDALKAFAASHGQVTFK